MFVIDGAEQVTSAVWLEFCKLAALVCDDGYQPEVLISGKPQAYEYLTSPMARDWNNHQFAVHRIPPLESLDVCVYIKERLNSAGLPEAVFSPPSRVLMGKLAGGSFVTTNLLCQMSLITARQRGVTFVDEEIVKVAYAELGKGQEQAVAREIPSVNEIGEDGELFVSLNGKLVSRHDLADELLLGRGGSNQVSLHSAEVSRRHATIVKADSDFYIEDLGSINGLTVNGELATRRKLVDRDVITIGPFQLTFAAPASAEEQSERLPQLRVIKEEAANPLELGL